jgi:hypothetical protein
MTGTPPPDYEPGVCNIGSAERRRRYRYAGACAVAAVAYAAAVLATSVPTALLLGLFVPFSLGTEFLLQARRSFCASFGFRGRFDLRGDGSGSVATDGGSGGSSDRAVEASASLTEPAGSVGRVTDPDARAADRRHALRLTVLGVLGGGAGATLAYALAVALG